MSLGWELEMEFDLILFSNRVYAIDPAALLLSICFLAHETHIPAPFSLPLGISGAGKMTPWLKALANLAIRFPAPRLGGSQEDT